MASNPQMEGILVSDGGRCEAFNYSFKIPFYFTPSVINPPCPGFNWMDMGISSCSGTGPRDIGHCLVEQPRADVVLAWVLTAPGSVYILKHRHTKLAVPTTGFFAACCFQERASHWPTEASRLL